MLMINQSHVHNQCFQYLLQLHAVTAVRLNERFTEEQRGVSQKTSKLATGTWMLLIGCCWARLCLTNTLLMLCSMAYFFACDKARKKIQDKFFFKKSAITEINPLWIRLMLEDVHVINKPKHVPAE